MIGILLFKMKALVIYIILLVHFSKTLHDVHAISVNVRNSFLPKK